VRVDDETNARRELNAKKLDKDENEDDIYRRSLSVLTWSARWTGETRPTFAAIAHAASAVETAAAPSGPDVARYSHLVLNMRMRPRVVPPRWRPVVRCRRSTLGSREAVQTAAQRRTNTLRVRYATARTDCCRTNAHRITRYVEKDLNRLSLSVVAHRSRVWVPWVSISNYRAKSENNGFHTSTEIFAQRYQNTDIRLCVNYVVNRASARYRHNAKIARRRRKHCAV